MERNRDFSLVLFLPRLTTVGWRDRWRDRWTEGGVRSSNQLKEEVKKFHKSLVALVGT